MLRSASLGAERMIVAYAADLARIIELISFIAAYILSAFPGSDFYSRIHSLFITI